MKRILPILLTFAVIALSTVTAQAQSGKPNVRVIV